MDKQEIINNIKGFRQHPDNQMFMTPEVEMVIDAIIDMIEEA